MHLKIFVILALLLCHAPAFAEDAQTRPFAMAMTTDNFDDTDEGDQRITALLRDHVDVVAVYLDNGVPWPEALEGKPFHPNVQKEIDHRLHRIPAGKKVFLALNIGAFDRRNLAAYWGENPNLPRPGPWADKSFDDEQIVEAYGNYCLRMIDLFKPDYLIYAIEINMMAGANPPGFEQYLALAGKVYPRLKAKHPTMLIFPSIQIDMHSAGQEENVRRLLKFSDAVAISTYPHFRGLTPATLPAGWFADVRKLAPDKPFLIAETGFPAEPYEGKWFTQPIRIEATPVMQDACVQWVLTEAARLDAVLVTWFFTEDIDRLWARQTTDEARTFVAMGRDLGMLDETLKPRPALTTWDQWRARPMSRR